jgi:mevalonate kinase
MDYPAKILLFGEYGILLNSMALAIPYSRFSGRFVFPDSSADKIDQRASVSNNELKGLLNYFKSNPTIFQTILLDLFELEVNKGLYFDSSIPSGSGLGSSGALTAAVYERFSGGEHPNEYHKIKSDLAAIESCFHGLSSGIDPLTSFLNKPVLLDNANSMIRTADLSAFLSTYTLFLINTHSTGHTAELVNRFLEQYRQPEFREIIDNQYLILINQIIGSIVLADFESFETLMARYSRLQLLHFNKMIPIPMIKYFEDGIRTNEFYLKLCGSGGGGYLLAISKERLKAEAYFNLNHLDYTIV